MFFHVVTFCCAIQSIESIISRHRIISLNIISMFVNFFPLISFLAATRTKWWSRESRNWSAQGRRERSMSRILTRPTRSNACQINDPVAITTGALLTAVLVSLSRGRSRLKLITLRAKLISCSPLFPTTDRTLIRLVVKYPPHLHVFRITLRKELYFVKHWTLRSLIMWKSVE